LLSFWRIADIPFDACLAALESWPLTGPDGELLLGKSRLHGPVERDHRLGTREVEVRLARGPLRPPLRMRLDIDHWSASSSALELIPCGNVRRGAAYFRAAHRLLDSLIHALSEYVPVQQDLGHDAAGQPGSPVDVLKGRGRAGGPLLPAP